MKTLILMAMALGFSRASLAQKIVADRIDKFTGNRDLETGLVRISENLLKETSVGMGLAGESMYLMNYNFGDRVGVIGDNDYIKFLLDNDSLLTLKPTHQQSYNVSGQGTWSLQMYAMSREDLNMLLTHKIKAMRRTYDQGTVDLNIREKDQGNVMKLAQVFISKL